MNTKRHNPWGPECSGLHIFDPQTDEINLMDISVALCGIRRFCGRGPTSVAQHSLYLADQCTTVHEQLYALLHDAAEAYLGDIPRPFRNTIPGYSVVEFGIVAAIYRHLKCEWPTVDDVAAVTDLDDNACMVEREHPDTNTTGKLFRNDPEFFCDTINAIALDVRACP